LRKQNKVGKPLRFISFYHLAQFKPQRGIHVYAIRIHSKQLYLVGHMRVAEITTRDAYLQEYPDDTPLISPFERVVFVRERATCIQPDTLVPKEMLDRFRYQSRGRERPLKHVKAGELTHPIGLTGVTRITKQTAQDFDFLLTGKAARPVAAPFFGP
jgi:hypothetical protein